MQASVSLEERPVRLHQEVRRSKPACDLDPTLALWDGPAADIEPLETGARTGVTVSECAAIGVMAMKAASPHMARACFILVLRKAWKGADARLPGSLAKGSATRQWTRPMPLHRRSVILSGLPPSARARLAKRSNGPLALGQEAVVAHVVRPVFARTFPMHDDLSSAAAC